MAARLEASGGAPSASAGAAGGADGADSPSLAGYDEVVYSSDSNYRKLTCIFRLLTVPSRLSWRLVKPWVVTLPL